MNEVDAGRGGVGGEQEGALSNRGRPMHWTLQAKSSEKPTPAAPALEANLEKYATTLNQQGASGARLLPE